MSTDYPQGIDEVPEDPEENVGEEWLWDELHDNEYEQDLIDDVEEQ